MPSGILYVEREWPGKVMWQLCKMSGETVSFYAKRSIRLGPLRVNADRWKALLIGPAGVRADSSGVYPTAYDVFKAKCEEDFIWMTAQSAGNPDFLSLVVRDSIPVEGAMAMLAMYGNSEEEVNRSIWKKEQTLPTILAVPMGTVPWICIVGGYYKWPATYFVSKNAQDVQKARLVCDELNVEVLEQL